MPEGLIFAARYLKQRHYRITALCLPGGRCGMRLVSLLSRSDAIADLAVVVPLYVLSIGGL